MYLHWHSCATEPGQVVGSQAGSPTRLVACLGFSHMCLGCCCSQLFIHLRSLLRGCCLQQLLYGSLMESWSAFRNGLPVTSEPWFLVFPLPDRIRFPQTIRRCASCEQPIPELIGWPWTSASTGPPLRCGSVHPQWPLANVRAYHIANCNLWQRILIAASGSVTLLKWQR